MATLYFFEEVAAAVAARDEHPNDNQLWYAPTTLQFGKGVRFDARSVPHVAVARRGSEFGASAPRLSVECRVLIVEEK